MIRVLALGLLASAVGACVPQVETKSTAGADWSRIGSATKVAQVSNLKSLIQPGVY